MKVRNVHSRVLAASPQRVGSLVDSLSSAEDALWPHRAWPRMTLDAPLGVGAAGGHGPIRYFVAAYSPGAWVRFRFTAPRGFEGTHRLECLPAAAGATTLVHTLEMEAVGPALLTWPLIFRPLHDALIEDALTTAEASLGLPLHVQPWSRRVKLLRSLFARRATPPQAAQFARR
jgi:hypothetical protein